MVKGKSRVPKPAARIIAFIGLSGQSFYATRNSLQVQQAKKGAK